MYNYLKGELFKIKKGRFIYISIIISIIFVIGIYLLYMHLNSSNVNLIKNLNDECFYLYLTQTIMFSSFILNDEYEYKTISVLNKRKLLCAKYLTILLFIIFNLILVFFISNILNLIYFKKVLKYFKLYRYFFISFSKYITCLIFLSLLSIFMSIIIHKSFLAISTSYIAYALGNYINNYIVIHKIKGLYYIPSFYVNYNNILLIKNDINIYLGYLLFLSILILIVLLSLIFIKDCRK